MASRRSVACFENEALATFLFEKWEEMAKKDTFTDRLEVTLSKAYKNLCDHKDPILLLKDASKIKGIGNWMLALLKEYFESNVECPSTQESSEPRATKGRGSVQYLPKKNSAPYAILITLYRSTQNGKDYMLKQELIDEAEVSGLSRMPIGPSKSGALPGRFGNAARDWYSGWKSMKTLISKGLVVKSSCPAKYMLTEEGKERARECLERSGMLEEVCNQQITHRTSTEHGNCDEMLSLSPKDRGKNTISAATKSGRNVCNKKRKSSDSEAKETRSFVTAELVDKVTGDNSLSAATKSGRMNACQRQRKSSALKEKMSWPFITTELVVDEDKAGPSSLEAKQSVNKEIPVCILPCERTDTEEVCWRKNVHIEPRETPNLSHCTEGVASTLRSTSSTSSNLSHYYQNDSNLNPDKVNTNVLAVPPLDNGDIFSDSYDIILILDDREQFGRDNRGSNSRQKVAERLTSQLQIQVEIRRLPIGDATWIARQKQLGQEYVLDFIIERKKVDDLSHSIKDNRYKDQKLRLMRCGIQRLIYLIEGDVNLTDASESIKSAAFTTEILEGFDVQRTRDLPDTVRKYGYLTHAIRDYYNRVAYMNRNTNGKTCMTFDEFVTKCHDLEKETVSDVFGVQLMQVPQVTEDVALAVLRHYPTVLSLAQAYFHLEGNLGAQELLLKDIPVRNQSKLIGGVISKNIHKFIWGDGK